MFLHERLAVSIALETYLTKQETTLVNGVPFFIKSLKDRTQFSDPDGVAAALGISSAMWPISGMLWPSGVVLAGIISQLSLANLRILEVGCGIGLASLVASSRGANITACDYHPLTPTLLIENETLNNLPHICYFHGNWHKPITNKGVYDLIIGSDLLYDKDNLDILATFINCHLAKKGQVIMIEPPRKLTKKFVKIMSTFRINCQVDSLPVQTGKGETLRYKQYTFTRDRSF